MTGIWPILHMPSFILVTGEKTDLWLVRTVGGLLAISGVVFFLESRKQKISNSVIVLAMAESAFLIAIDVIYSLSDVISNIYLLDAAAEAALLAIWIFICFKHSSKSA